jgi:carboxymethylenebutenolidase
MCDDDVHPGRIEDLGRTGSGIALAVLEAPGGDDSEIDAAAVVETDVEVTTPDGVTDAVLFHPAPGSDGEGPWPGVLLWPDAMGLRPVFRDMGRRLASAGYVVLVPNLYYRLKRAPVLEGPFDFAIPEDRAKLTALMAGIDPDGTVRDAIAYVAFLDDQPQTDTSKPVGVQGYCMGGGLSFRTAAAVPDRIGAVASFHGGALATDSPASPHRLIPQTNAEYLVAVADNDDQRDPDSKVRLADAFAAAGRPNKIEVYDGADHGWTVQGSEIYNEPAAEKAWSELLTLYRRALA